MDAPPPLMPRVRAYLTSQGFRPEKFDKNKQIKAIEDSTTAIATTMPKLVETLDNIQEDFRRVVYTSLQSPESRPYFWNKYHTFLEDMLVDLYHKNPPQIPPFKLYLWTLKYESKQSLATLAESDAHGPLPHGWNSWVTTMLANVIAFQQHKLKVQKDKLLRHLEELFIINDAPDVIEKIPGTAMQVTWQEIYERVRDFNRILAFMSDGYWKVMGNEQRDDAALQKGARPKTIYELLREQIIRMYPKIELADFTIEEDLGPAPLDNTYDGSELRRDLRWLLKRHQEPGINAAHDGAAQPSDCA